LEDFELGIMLLGLIDQGLVSFDPQDVLVRQLEVILIHLLFFALVRAHMQYPCDFEIVFAHEFAQWNQHHDSEMRVCLCVCILGTWRLIRV
jgi:hypothetical protein